MDFFGAQDSARRASGRLVFLFALVVAAVVAVLYVAVEFYAGAQVAPDGLRQFQFEFEPRRLAAVAAVVGGLILLAAGCKIIALKSGGGDGVARALGCRLVERETANPAEKRLINIVDEMALAAGAQPPAVYLSPDPQTINAFAAGFDESDAVIGVTEGALSRLVARRIARRHRARIQPHFARRHAA